MIQVNTREARTRLSELLERVQDGEEVIIAKAGKPIARLSKLSSRKPLIYGSLPQLKTPDDFNAPLSNELMEAFEGEL